MKEFKSGEWHEFRILVEGNRHRHWINGHPTADLIDLHESGRKMEGVLAMQVHKGPPMTVEFKEMRIKHLPDNLSLLTRADSIIPKGARGVRPQGKLPENWKPPVFDRIKNVFSGKTWFLIFLLLIILALGIRRHLRIQSVTERFETNSSLLEDVDLDAILKEAQSK